MAWLEWLARIHNMNAIIHISTIVFWLIGIIAGIEYFSDKWPKAKRIFSAIALIGFLLALSDEYVSYRYDEFKDPGVEVSEWFHARDAKEEAFTISDDPVTGSIEVLINGLIEPNDIYSVKGRSVTVSTRLSSTDMVTIKYRHKV